MIAFVQQEARQQNTSCSLPVDGIAATEKLHDAIQSSVYVHTGGQEQCCLTAKLQQSYHKRDD